ncbi:hypothetical protein KAI04_02350 [Candidatus Pacearchaeota archaeon]|nr:hypothetical protein [Candidatus Pacearchaeota archaeon]
MTEKNYNPQQKEKKAMKKQEVVGKVKKPEKVIEASKKVEEKKTEIVKTSKEKLENVEEQKAPEKKEAVSETKPQDSPTKNVKQKKEAPKIKKTEVFVKGINLPISTKDAKFVCKFIMKKKIRDAIRDLRKVEIGRKAVPMTGEIPHRKGKGISSGRFPKKAAKNFINILKSLAANANEGSLDEPIIVEAMANMAARPYGRFGRTQKKRTHVKITAKDQTQLKNKKKVKKNGGKK